MNQKVKQETFLKYLWLLHIPKKFILGHLLRPGSEYGSGPRRPDPTKKVRIRNIGSMPTILLMGNMFCIDFSSNSEPTF
jgi:hypothetical protein